MSLSQVQARLKAPKGQRNHFGNYNYRSLEDICEAVKPLLEELGYHLIIEDDIQLIGDRYYIKATATIYEGDKVLGRNSAFAREPENKKGMDEAQITGATSSYARKYALNGLFCIDDTKDADATNRHGKAESSESRDDGEAIPTQQEILDVCTEKLGSSHDAILWIKTQMIKLYSCDSFKAMNKFNKVKMLDRVKGLNSEEAKADFAKLRAS